MVFLYNKFTNNLYLILSHNDCPAHNSRRSLSTIRRQCRRFWSLFSQHWLARSGWLGANFVSLDQIRAIVEVTEHTNEEHVLQNAHQGQRFGEVTCAEEQRLAHVNGDQNELGL